MCSGCLNKTKNQRAGGVSLKIRLFDSIYPKTKSAHFSTFVKVSALSAWCVRERERFTGVVDVFVYYCCHAISLGLLYNREMLVPDTKLILCRPYKI